MDLFFIQNDTNYASNKRITDVKPGDKNLDIKVILLNLVIKNKLKNESKLAQFLVADNSGSILCNFFDDVGDSITEGDVIYLKSCYASIFKNKMILYCGRPGYGQVVKLGYFFMTFSDLPNMSEINWRREKDEKTGLDVYLPEIQNFQI
jgi:hypothetical protein